MARGSYCPGCFEKQRKIDQLLEENENLKQKLRYQELKAQEGFFGSSTPSSKIPLKPNQSTQRKPKGAKVGHKGTGRKGFQESEADQVVEIGTQHRGPCPHCGGPLQDKGSKERFVLDTAPLRLRRILYRLRKIYCPQCKKVFQPAIPGLLPRSLYGNQLVATVAVMHYLHGIPLGRICEQMHLSPGSLSPSSRRSRSSPGGGGPS